MIYQKQITVRIHAVIKNCDSLVMVGKRCIEQRHHYDQPAARAYLAKHWALLPSSVRGKDRPFTLERQRLQDDNCKCAECLS